MDRGQEDGNSPYLCIIMEYADSGDLFQRIQEFQRENKNFPENDIWKIAI